MHANTHANTHASNSTAHEPSTAHESSARREGGWWREHGFAAHTLSQFSQAALRHDVIWQPSGGVLKNPDFGEWQRAQKYRARNHLPENTTDPLGQAFPRPAEPDLSYQLAPGEVRWLRAAGVRWYNYTKLAQDYAALMSDGRHFSYYWKPCSQVRTPRTYMLQLT